jgi:WD40 repeat protein
MKRFTLFFFLLLPLYAQAQKPELVVPIGHTSYVESVAISPNGKYALSGSQDETVKLWEISSGKLLRTLEGHNWVVTSVAFSPDGNLAISSSYDGTLILWKVSSGKLIKRLDSGSGSVYSVTFSPNGRLILSATENGELIVWETSTGKLIRRLKEHTGSVSSVAFSANGRFAMSSSLDDTIIIWEVNSWKIVQRLKGNNSPGGVLHAAFSPDGKYVLSESKDGINLNLLDVSSGLVVRRFEGHNSWVSAVKFSPDGRYALSSSWDGALILWDVSSGMIVRRFEGQARRFEYYKNCINDVVFSANGHYALSGSNDRSLVLWDVVSGRPVKQFTGHTTEVGRMDLSPDGNYILTAQSDGLLNLWQLNKGSLVKQFRGHDGWIDAVKFSSDGQFILSTDLNNRIILWGASTGKQLQHFTIGDRVNAIAISPDNRFILAGRGSKLYIWEISSGTLIHQFTGLEGIISIAMSPNGHFIVAGCGKKLILWDFNTKKQIKEFIGHTHSIPHIVFSDDNRSVLSFSYDKSFIEWDINSGNVLRKIVMNNHGYYPIVFSPDGNFAFSAGQYVDYLNDFSKRLTLWDLKTGKELKRFEGHKAKVNGVLLASRSLLFSCSEDNTTKIWNANSGKEIATLIAIDSTDWVVTTPSGLFDASPGAMKLMHYVVNDPTDNDEPWKVIELDQLKQRYYQPGLLPILMGFSKEPLRQVPAFEGVNLPPGIQLSIESDILTVKIKNRRGGIGRVAVFINGAEVVEDLRTNPRKDVTQTTLTLTLPLARFANRYDTQNTIRVVAANGAGWLTSRPAEISYRPAVTTRGGEAENSSSSAVRKTVRLRAVVVGTSNVGLHFAHTDAEQIANSLRLAATELLGPTNVSVQLLVTKPDNSSQATKEDIVKALEAARQTRPEDIFVLHLSGHAINYGGQDGDLYYLTAGAKSADAGYLNDPAIRQTYTLSSQELTRYLNQIPARKKLLILDVCAAGKGAEKLLVAARDIPASQIRALDRLQGRTGFYVLAGSAADAVSYEASVYGQGLLTYALLKGLRGAALRREGTEEFVDVEKWLGYAVEQVPLLAKGIGGIQQPFYRGIQNQRSFDLGRVTESIKTKIRIAEPKPVLLVKSFQEETQFDDVLDLKNKLESALNDLIAVRGADAPVLTMDAKDYPGAYTLSGRYKLRGEVVSVSCKIFRYSASMGEFVVTGTKSKLPDLAQLILSRAQGLVKP